MFLVEAPGGGKVHRRLWVKIKQNSVDETFGKTRQSNDFFDWVSYRENRFA